MFFFWFVLIPTHGPRKAPRCLNASTILPPNRGRSVVSRRCQMPRVKRATRWGLSTNQVRYLFTSHNCWTWAWGWCKLSLRIVIDEFESIFLGFFTRFITRNGKVSELVVSNLKLLHLIRRWLKLQIRKKLITSDKIVWHVCFNQPSMFVFVVKITKGKNVDPSNRKSGNSEVVSWEWKIGLKRKIMVHWSMLEPSEYSSKRSQIPNAIAPKPACNS